MTNINVLNFGLEQDDDMLFKNSKILLENSSRCSYAQYSVITEEVLLKDMGLLKNNRLEIKTNLDTIDFGRIGESLLEVVLFDTHTKERSSHLVELYVFPSKKEYSLLRNIYWRAYGLVIEGQVSYTGISLSRNQGTFYSLELISLDDASEKKFSINLKDGNITSEGKFHAILEDRYLEKLKIREYDFQIKMYDGSGSLIHASRLVEKGHPNFFSTYPFDDSMCLQLEPRKFQNTSLHCVTSQTGEVRLKITG